MRTANYSQILNASAGLAGFQPADVGVAEFALFRQFHDRRFQTFWEFEAWPDLCPIEQRTFRPPWNSATTYATTAEVYDPLSMTYYQSLANANLNNPPTTYTGGTYVVDGAHWALCQRQYSAAPWVAGTYAQGAQVLSPLDNNYYQLKAVSLVSATDPSADLTNWGLLTPFNRYIAWQQYDKNGAALTPIGEFLRATDKDPRVTTKVVELPYDLSPDGAQFVQLRHQFSFVWLKYRKQRPMLTGDPFDATVAYASGRQAYYTQADGSSANFWTATTTTTPGDTPESAPGKWSIVQIPYIFLGSLIAGGYADWLTSDGQAAKATAQELMITNGQGTGYLDLEVDKFRRQQGQTTRLRWQSQ